MPRARWFLARATMLFAALLAQRATAQLDEPPLTRTEASISLADYLPVADVYAPVRSFDFAAANANDYLTSGWHKIEGKPGELYCWTKQRTAVMEVPIVRPRPMVLRLIVSPVGGAKRSRLPSQRLRVLWNGEECVHALIDEADKEVEVRIPAELQRFGPNRLTLEIGYWVIPRAVHMGHNARNLGVLCRLFEFITETKEIGPPQKLVALEGDTIQQGPGTVMTFFVPVPHNAALRAGAKLALLDGELPGDAQGRATVVVTAQDGDQKILFEQDIAGLADGSGFDIEADLAEYAGQMAAITFSFSLDGVDDETDAAILKTCRLAWKRPTISGVRKILDCARLEAALEGLRGRYNIFIILFDSLRADYTEAYGGAEPALTPFMKRLAAAGVLFKNSHSSSSWTRTSVASILTGLTPESHGVHTFYDGILPTMPFLPELLQQEGYKTMAILNNLAVDPDKGFSRGFDVVRRMADDRYAGKMWDFTVPGQFASFVWDNYMQPLLMQDPEKPFFVYLHEVDPHVPWNAPKPYEDLYDFGYEGKLDCAGGVVSLLRMQAMDLSPADLRYIKGSYKAEITFMDEYLEWMANKLHSTGLAGNTLVLFISDHGVELLEHGAVGHFWQVTEEVLHVPMIWSLPGKFPQGTYPTALAQLLDIPPTLLDIVGAHIPQEIQGRSLLPFFVAPENVALPVPAFGKVRKDHRDSVIFGNWKLLKHERKAWKEYLLYDLADDPGEQIDRWAQKLVVGKTLQQMLKMEWHEGRRRFQAYKDAAPAEEPVEKPKLSREALEDLQAMGYLR